MDNLSHYTSVDGFKSIIDNKSLRLTRSEFLNDPTDCKVLISLITNYLELKKYEIDKLLDKSKYSELKEIYSKAPLLEYITFLQDNIHLYVLSLTTNSDEMSMWNYYGNGGIQIVGNASILVKELSEKMANDNEYIAISPVKYVSGTDTIESMVIDAFNTFKLVSRDCTNVFDQHLKDLERAGQPHKLYDTTDLSIFMQTYINSYITALEYLIDNKKISVDSTATEVFTLVHHNANSLTNKMVWKKDLTLYMMILSALIKSDTYQYENEVRIVYFENTLQATPSAQEVRYDIQSLQGQRYIKPYVEIGELKMDFINSLILSPLTRNLPIDSNLYIDIICNFIHTALSRTDISAYWSKHRIRW